MVTCHGNVERSPVGTGLSHQDSGISGRCERRPRVTPDTLQQLGSAMITSRTLSEDKQGHSPSPCLEPSAHCPT